MTTKTGVGQSEYSPLKEEHYSKILAWHQSLSYHVINNDRRNDYLMIDATAGTGKLYECGGIDGSPLVFLQQASEHLSDCKWQAVFCEQNPEHFAKLHSNVGAAPCVTLRPESYQDVLRRYTSQWQIGLLYIDPNGTPDFDALCTFARRNPRMEILISVTANGVKRGGLTEYRLHEWIEKIGKKYWAIRKPYGPWQWTFLFGSDFAGFNKNYKSIDLYPVTSPIGKAYMDQATYTREERSKNAQPPLIDLTPNT